MNRTAVIYARVSSASDRQSTDRQVADLRAFAEKEGIEVVGEYEEHGSGAREDRPELLRCVEFLRRGGCSTLLVSEISRLGRTVKGVVNTIDELTKVGVNVYVQDINLWTLLPDGSENPMAKVILTILALGAELERKSIACRLSSGRERAKERGVRMGRPEGSKMSDEDLLKKYPDVAKKLRKGLSIREVAKLCGRSVSTVQRVKKIL
jgi:DNA invertase Pin-like site-specific DNA recombinase